MIITEMKQRDDALIANLLEIWESAVRATHLFLSPSDIERIKNYVPQALQGVAHLFVAYEGEPVAFMGVEKQKIEMLFVRADKRGAGIGKALVQEGIAKYAVSEVAVNEQNPLAKVFYEHLGFAVVKRSEKDGQGKPYPLLYMRLEK